MFLGYGFTSGLMMQVSELSYRGIFKPIVGYDQACKLLIISWNHPYTYLDIMLWPFVQEV